jgi:ABC-type multidrug transport system ATPase subunit
MFAAKLKLKGTL